MLTSSLADKNFCSLLQTKLDDVMADEVLTTDNYLTHHYSKNTTVLFYRIESKWWNQ